MLIVQTFLENKLDISCKLYQLETICMKCQTLFSGEIKMLNCNTLPLSKLAIQNQIATICDHRSHTKFGENPLRFTQVIIWTKNRQADIHLYVWTFDICWVLQSSFFGSKYPTRCLNTQQVPQIYWVLTLDTYRINGKYPIHVYPIYAHSCAIQLTDRWTDTRTSNMKP